MSVYVLVFQVIKIQHLGICLHTMIQHLKRVNNESMISRLSDTQICGTWLREVGEI